MVDNEFLNKFMEKMRLDEKSYNKLHAAILGGSNKVAHNTVNEALTIDSDWISVFENAIYSIEQIVRNPRKFIVEEEDIVDVSRAKRINSKTVRHLSAHTQYIQNISKSGDVQPSKVLVSELSEDLAIYENRFVCSLVERLVVFAEQRYQELSGKFDVYDNTTVGYHSEFKIGESQFVCDMNVKVKEPPKDTATSDRNAATLRRVENVRARLRSIQNTPLMVFLRTKKPVRPPIQKTNMLRMNTDYSTCYKLWLYISSYKFVGFSVDVQEKNLPVGGDYYDDLTVIAALSAQAMLSDRVLNRKYYDSVEVSSTKRKKYRVVKKIDFKPTFGDDNKKSGEDAVNEYYFNAMRKEIAEATRKNTVYDEKQITMSFRRFFRAIQSINEEMFADVIESQLPEEGGRTPLQKKEAKVRRQKAILKRKHQLSQLYREQFEKALRAEKRDMLKLEKLQAELDKEKGKKLKKQELAERKKRKAQKIEDEKLLAERNADEYEQGLREDIAAKNAEKEAERARKREQAARRRDKKRYEELRRKFGDDANSADTDGGTGAESNSSEVAAENLKGPDEQN